MKTQKIKFNSPFRTFLMVTLISFTSLFAFQSCKKEDMEGGSMEVEMTDSPGDYAAVNVEITKVETRHESEGWVTLESNSRTYTVTDLTNGTSTRIGSSTELSAGTYNMIRLTFGANSNIQASAGGSSAAFNSLLETTVEIPIDVEISASASSNVLLDFHVGESVVGTLVGFDLNPTLTWVQDRNTGVKGSVSSTSQAWVKIYNSNETYDTYVDNSGNFTIQGMASGTYTVEIYPSEDSGFAEMTTYQNVSVANGEFTNMGSLTLQ